MASQVTVTSKTGPAQTVTALVLSDVVSMNFDLVRDILQVTQVGVANPKEFDISVTTTITDAVSSGNHTWVVSQ